MLKVTKDQPYFKLESKTIYALYDFVHTFKSIRNIHLKYDLETPDGIAEFGIIRSAYTMDSKKKQSTRMCPKLTEKHISPNSFEKMRVKLATQVYSRGVSVAIKTMADLNKFRGQRKIIAYSTANFIEKMNNLFDAMNSKQEFDKNPFRRALQNDNNINTYLQDMIAYLEKIKVINAKRPIYCIEGTIQTIKAILLLGNDLFSDGNIHYLPLNKLVQDPLENLFAFVREWCITNTNPTVYEFNHILAKIQSLRIVRNKMSDTNCEEDECEFVSDILDTSFNNGQNESTLSTYIGTEELTESNTDAMEDNEFIKLINHNINSANKNDIDLNSMRYVTGYIIHKFKKKINCSSCSDEMISNTSESLKHKSELFIFNKNYSNLEVCALKTPTDFFFEITKINIRIFEEIFYLKPDMNNIKSNIFELCIKRTPEWFAEGIPCSQHRKDILNILLILLIRRNCAWLKDKMLNELKVKPKNVKVKNNDDNHSNANKKLKIIQT